MKRICLLGGVAALMSLQVMAEPTSYRCTYQESTYEAAFMEAPATRQCPNSHCYYDLVIDEAAASASVNGTTGYQLQVEGNTLTLSRSAVNPIMGGTDTATFTLERDSGRFVGKKTTSPEVTVTSFGSCNTQP
ncbi:hypothetical protein [Motiliproteus sp. SC1-56]|uniref:hypothetical protein n=1 Tax=Motiliproteus sp. SC1-56 TaxID=2799565 RepID=UPI001A8F35CA|nr:hypothetical protein [Motiliproteus sp. SC1-56]